MDPFLNSHFNILAEPTFGRTKKIRVWINGDSSNRCFEVTLNPNGLRTWNTVLQYLTHTISPPFGAIRKLICLRSKKTVTCFEELNSSEKYIALGINSKLIIMKHGYKSSSEQELLNAKKPKRKLYSGDMNSENFQFLQDTKKRNLTVIYMVANGQVCQSPTKVVLNENDVCHWNVSLQFIAKVLDIPEGIQHICTIFGDIVTDPFELQHGFLYVAVPFSEKFEKIDYTSTFGKNNNKSSYVLKMRQNKPSKVCCSIRGNLKDFVKINCNKSKKCNDEKECRQLLPEEIPESCTRIDSDKKGQDIMKIIDCCLANDKNNVWCRSRKYKPECCETQKVLGKFDHKLEMSEENGEQNSDTSTERTSSAENTNPTGKDSMHEKKVETDKNPAPEENCDCDICECDDLSNDSIEDVTTSNDKIVTYFSREDKASRKNENRTISTNILRGTQTVADFPQINSHHVTISTLHLPDDVHQKIETIEKNISTTENPNSAMYEIEDKPVKVDRSSNTEKFQLQEEKGDPSDISKFSQYTITNKYDPRFDNRVSRGISAIISDVNAYPYQEPKKNPSILIKNKTDINVVGYSNRDKRHRRDMDKKCYESSSISDSSSSVSASGHVERFDNLCCFCREARKINGSISRYCPGKHVLVSKRNRRCEKQKKPEQVLHSNVERTYEENDNIPTKMIPRKMSDCLEEETSPYSTISEEKMENTVDNIENTHKDNISSTLADIPRNYSGGLEKQKSRSKQILESTIHGSKKSSEDKLSGRKAEIPRNYSGNVEREKSYNNKISKSDSENSIREIKKTSEDQLIQTTADISRNYSGGLKKEKSYNNNISSRDLDSTIDETKQISKSKLPIRTADIPRNYSGSLKKEKSQNNNISEKNLENAIDAANQNSKADMPRNYSGNLKKEKSLNISERDLENINDEAKQSSKSKLPRRTDSGRSHSSRKNPEDNIPSLESDDAKVEIPRRKSSLRNSSAASVVQKVMKIIEDNMPFSDSEQDETTEEVSSTRQDREQSPKRRSIHRESSRLSQNLERIPEVSSSLNSEEALQNLIRRKSSQHASAINAVQKIKKTIEENLPLVQVDNDQECPLETIENLSGTQDPEECQEISSRKRRSRNSCGCCRREKCIAPESENKNEPESYSDTILNVKKILEKNTAEITEVLSKVKANQEKNKTKNVLSSSVMKAEQDVSHSSDSNGENTMAHLS